MCGPRNESADPAFLVRKDSRIAASTGIGGGGSVRAGRGVGIGGRVCITGTCVHGFFIVAAGDDGRGD